MAPLCAVPLSCGMVTESCGETTTFLGNGFIFLNSLMYFFFCYPCKHILKLIYGEKSHRINLPKRKRRDWLKDLEREASPPEHELDAASEASSEPDYSYEFAQMEVIMKTLNSNGRPPTPPASVQGPSFTSP